MTHTYVVLEVSQEAYTEIHDKLMAAGYSHAISSAGEIDMHGIAVVPDPNAPKRAPDVHCATCQCNKLHASAPMPDNPRSRSWHDNALTQAPKP